MLAALMAGAVAKVSVDTLPDNGPTNITDDNDVDGVADGRTRAYGVVRSADVGANISIVLEAGAAGALPPDRERSAGCGPARIYYAAAERGNRAVRGNISATINGENLTDRVSRHESQSQRCEERTPHVSTLPKVRKFLAITGAFPVCPWRKLHSREPYKAGHTFTSRRPRPDRQVGFPLRNKNSYYPGYARVFPVH